MSLAEMKSAIDQLSDKERFDLRNYLQDQMWQNEEWRTEMSRRLDEMDAGKKFTSKQVEALVRQLEAEGR